jgi:hypothetical protein
MPAKGSRMFVRKNGKQTHSNPGRKPKTVFSSLFRQPQRKQENTKHSQVNNF